MGKIPGHAGRNHRPHRQPRQLELQDIPILHERPGKKGYISSEKRGRDKFYSPAISREECIARESRAVLSKMQSDSVGLMITSMVREGDLSRSDRLELMNMLEKMLKEETENESDR